MENYEIRALVDDRNEKTGKKIRDAEVAKVPFMIIIGEREENEGMISVRKHGGEDLGKMTVKDFESLLSKEIENTLQQF